MSDDGHRGGLGPWILFPEIIGISIIALLLPLPLVHLLMAGHAFYGTAGLLIWLASTFYSVRFIRRRDYGLACLPMLGVVVLFWAVYRLCP
jgi:hypothetical protein